MLCNRFETILADSVEAVSIHFKVRYQSYAIETAYEDACNYPDAAEVDEYDEYSRHFLVYDHLVGRWCGTMRLIDAAKTVLPSESVSSSPLKGLESERSIAAELSRFAISRDYRHCGARSQFGSSRLSRTDVSQSANSDCFRRVGDAILLQLIRAAFHWGRRNGLLFLYFLVEPSLARLLKQLGIPLEVLGPSVQHRGERIPYRCNILSAERGISGKSAKHRQFMEVNQSVIPYSEFVAKERRPRVFSASPTRIIVTRS